jgi:hypothetical protein
MPYTEQLIQEILYECLEGAEGTLDDQPAVYYLDEWYGDDSVELPAGVVVKDMAGNEFYVTISRTSPTAARQPLPPAGGARPVRGLRRLFARGTARDGEVQA